MSKTKTLYVLVSNNGDGSCSPRYTFNSDWIMKQEERDVAGESDYEYDLGVDGDGFHYDALTVPVECTLESLGIHSDCAADEDEDDE